MDLQIFIDGDQGTTGLDLQNRLRGEGFHIRTLPAHLRKDAAARRAALNESDIAILCLPDAALLRPLTDAGLLPADYPLVIHAVSGYSGQGRAGAEAHEAGAGAHSLKVYGLALEHKHVPEIEAYAGLSQRPIFVPAYGSYRQGIVLTIGLHARWLSSEASGARIHECLAERYRDAAHVRV